MKIICTFLRDKIYTTCQKIGYPEGTLGYVSEKGWIQRRILNAKITNEYVQDPIGVISEE